VSQPDWQADLARMQARDRKARALLGVSATAEPAELRRAFRRASLANHPDVNRDDPEASRRFRLVRGAYRFLAEGEACAELDELEEPPAPPTDGKYRLDNPWGYWCWWRETYFDDLT